MVHLLYAVACSVFQGGYARILLLKVKWLAETNIHNTEITLFFSTKSKTSKKLTMQNNIKTFAKTTSI